MSALALHEQFVTPEAYLASELRSPIKHEYIGGAVHAMAGARNAHNQIAGSTFLALGKRLFGKKCRPFNSDTKVRVKMPNQLRFYYPDVQVVCDSNPHDDSFQDRPVVIVEVLSKATRRLDEGEKWDAYQTIPSLDAYILVDSTHTSVLVFRRTDSGFKKEVYTERKSSIPLDSIGIELPLSEIYDGMDFADLALVK